ncbi:uncharacterized protein G2W53_037061 [Senna tora]|uniref:Uncharacterized protein n=1 Tax=Senna tora TaxID=362788 RepID=A0A834W6P9_9FABA|nr:uncharacterized protein G2W53_037061 [Senna tora]
MKNSEDSLKLIMKSPKMQMEKKKEKQRLNNPPTTIYKDITTMPLVSLTPRALHRIDNSYNLPPRIIRRLKNNLTPRPLPTNYKILANIIMTNLSQLPAMVEEKPSPLAKYE